LEEKYYKGGGQYPPITIYLSTFSFLSTFLEQQQIVIFISLSKRFPPSSGIYIYLCPQNTVHITHPTFRKELRLKLKDFLGYF